MNPPGALWTGGPNPFQGGYYQFPQNRPQAGQAGPKAHTMSPMTTGTSVFGLQYRDGVLLAADTLGSYGSMARFPDLQRVIRLNETTALACSGDIADFQFLSEVLEQKQITEEIGAHDGKPDTMSPKALHSWLTRFLYNKRSRFDPLWTNIIVGGLQDGEPYLGYVNMIGVAFTEKAIATGLGADVAVPVLRNALEKKPANEMSLEEATELLESCMRLCFFRDCRASSKYHLAVINKDGSVVRKAKELNTNNDHWQYALNIRGFE